MKYYGCIAHSEVKEQLGKRCASFPEWEEVLAVPRFRRATSNGPLRHTKRNAGPWRVLVFPGLASKQWTRTLGSGGILTYARRIQRGTRCAYVQNVEPSWFRRKVSSGSTYA